MVREVWGQTASPFLVGRSEAIRHVMDLVETVAQSDCCVVIEGESGTGKELVARRLHSAGTRRDGPFIPVNCAGVSETLFESQFFGHVRGAFTGAEEAMLGLIRSAEGGVLFMDEIGEVPFSVQPKLLRALQDGEVMPVGTATPLATNARFIAATNRDLYQEVVDGRFREDLFYRLNVVKVYLPPLRDRPEDVDPLLDHFLGKCAKRYARPPASVPSEVRRKLAGYRWPGNVRELANWVERLFATKLDPGTLVAALLAQTDRRRQGSDSRGPVVSLAEAERRAVRAAMEAVGGSLKDAARLLQVHRSTLSRKLRDYDMA